MGVAKPVLMTMAEFRKTHSFSGEVHVRPGSRKRRGVRRQGRRASCKSLEELAGTVAASEAATGESARASAAHAASRSTDTGLAKSKTKNAARTSSKTATKKQSNAAASAGVGGGGGPVESLWEERAMLDGGDPLPQDGPGFVDCVNDYIDLVRTTELLLRDPDAKSSKSLLELLLEMKYGKDARAAAEGIQGVINGSSHAGN